MFQNFDDTGGPEHVAARVSELRAELATAGVDGFLFTTADEYQNEIPPDCARRLAWLTGFTGSWGAATVFVDKAVLFVDGRYELQAPAQTDTNVFAVMKAKDEPPEVWLEKQTLAGSKLGYDPRLLSISAAQKFEKAAKKAGAALVPLTRNPIDLIWRDRPAPPAAPVFLHELRYAGRTAEDKLAELQKALAAAGEDAVLITAPESVAWLLNIRGGDVARTPLPLSIAAVPVTGKPRLYIAPAKVSAEVRAALEAFVTVDTPEGLEECYKALEGKKVRLDPSRASVWHAQRLKAAGATVVEGDDPCLLPRARKNETEIAGARAAHRRDAVAMIRFLAWLDAEAANGLDEISAAQKLEEFRRAAPELLDLSFDSISGAGPNGAIVHYRVTRATNRRLEPGSLYLIDSGGQYADGTTDITRTVAIGEPSADMRRHFTLVLKGHIAIAKSHFPPRTRGAQLDGFARRALWQAGFDYDHGTGHGVGSFLSVHEGPASISGRGTAALEPGMIVSNEPGYYREGHYGIRLENLLLVTPPAPIPGGEREMMGFETLTLVPMDRRLIEPEMLSAAERIWLNDYHHRIHEEIGPLLGDDGERAWLAGATAPVSASAGA